MVVILLVAAALRLYLLEADAPLDVSPTQELTLDGPVTVAAARDRALYGSWDPFPGPLQPYRYYPGMNWLAYLFFKLIGVGYWQANLVSVVTGFLSILFLAAFARSQFGRRVSLFSALFMAVSFIYIVYNRDPMAYTTAACGVTLSLFCWGLGRRRPLWMFFSGAVMAFNTLFIKLPGIAFLPAALLGFALLAWPHRRRLRTRVLLPGLLFCAGAVAVLLTWFLFIYLPHAQDVEQAYYVRTFSPAYSLLDNIRFAVQSMLFFGVEFGFNLRMLPLFGLSYGYVFYRLSRLLSPNRPWPEPGEIVVLALLISTVGMLFFSGIRPLRFQILLIPPMALTAALTLDGWLRHRRLNLASRFGLAYPVFVLTGLTYFSYQILAALLMLYRMIQFESGPVSDQVALDVGDLYSLLTVSLLFGLLGTLVFVWQVVQKGRKSVALPSPTRRSALAILALGAVVGIQLTQYWSWAKQPAFSVMDASRAVGDKYESESMVLGGTYAYTLALENNIPAVWFFSDTPQEVRLAYGVTHFARSYEAEDDQELIEAEAERPCEWTQTVRGYLVKICEIGNARLP
jgi:4-amino-4-deoxy-L-arabinose transferase-like glycosyltransferase